MNPRNHRWAWIPLEQAEGVGNFRLDLNSPRVMAKDANGRELGPLIVAIYGHGDYRPHNPSHFLDHFHARGHTGDDADIFVPRRRRNNPPLEMDSEDS